MKNYEDLVDTNYEATAEVNENLGIQKERLRIGELVMNKAIAASTKEHMDMYNDLLKEILELK